MTPLSLTHGVRPADASEGRPPLLLLMHGVGSHERAMTPLAATVDGRFLVLSVRSPIPVGPDAFAWFHVQFTATGPVLNATEFEAGWRRLSAFVDEAVAHYGADPQRVYLAGFSQGGILALSTWLARPRQIAGAVMMSGRLPPEIWPHVGDPEGVRAGAALIVHGTGDDKLPVGLARDARARVEGLGATVAYQEFAMGHQVGAQSWGVVQGWLSGRLERA